MWRNLVHPINVMPDIYKRPWRMGSFLMEKYFKIKLDEVFPDKIEKTSQDVDDDNED